VEPSVWLNVFRNRKKIFKHEKNADDDLDSEGSSEMSD
jgi:hypothetical protein